MTQTAVEWIIQELKDLGNYKYSLEKLLEQAKEMEKQQSNKLSNVIKDSMEKLDAEVPFGESDSYDVMV